MGGGRQSVGGGGGGGIERPSSMEKDRSEIATTRIWVSVHCARAEQHCYCALQRLASE